MYEIFERLLAVKGITAYKVAKETGITTSTFSEWKKGSYVPKNDKLQKIADYLGVSLEYLMGAEKTVIAMNDPVYELMNADPELIKAIKHVIKSGYSADDLISAINMLNIARGRK